MPAAYLDPFGLSLSIATPLPQTPRPSHFSMCTRGLRSDAAFKIGTESVAAVYESRELFVSGHDVSLTFQAFLKKVFR